MADAKEATSSSKPRLLPWFQSVLTLVAGSLGLVAAIGLPAVAVHLQRFGAPLGVASYNDVLRAGALPAVVLVLITGYGWLARRALQKGIARQFIGAHGLLLLPAFIAAYVVLIVGLLAYSLVATWLLLWPFNWLLGAFFDTDFDNRALLIVAASIVFVFTVGFAARRLATKTPETTEGAPTDKSTQNSKRPFKWGLVALAAMVVLMVYCIKFLLHLWDPLLGVRLSHALVIETSVAMLVVGGIFGGGIYLMASGEPEAPAKPRRTGWVILAATFAFVGFEAGYCAWAYPRMYSGLGGGRPVRATLWLDRSDGADDIRAVLANAEIRERDTLRSIENVYIVLDSSGTLLLTDAAQPPGKAVLVSKSRIQAISW